MISRVKYPLFWDRVYSLHCFDHELRFRTHKIPVYLKKKKKNLSTSNRRYPLHSGNLGFVIISPNRSILRTEMTNEIPEWIQHNRQIRNQRNTQLTSVINSNNPPNSIIYFSESLSLMFQTRCMYNRWLIITLIKSKIILSFVSGFL